MPRMPPHAGPAADQQGTHRVEPPQGVGMYPSADPGTGHAGRTAQQQGSSYTDGGFQRAAFASRMIGPPAVQCLPQQLGTQPKVAEWDGKHARHAIQQHKAAGAASRQ